jgi:NACHT domain/NB-ARC domain
MESSGYSRVDAQAAGRARQVNIGGDNYGPVYMAEYATARRLPRQLPFVAADFTSRGEQQAIRGWLTTDPPPRVVNIYGMPGSGKSTLAIYLGHELAAVYPDCQIYFNLRNSGQRAVSVDDLLGGALVALGLPISEMPSGLMLRETAFRSALSELRSVIVIDNASDASQVESLLPGSSEAAVLVTSWAPIPELPGIRTVPLGPLCDQDAVAMLQAVSRREVQEEVQSIVHQVARLVGNLPLALRIAGGLLKARPYWSWQDLLQRLGGPDEFARLDMLKSGQLAVRDAFNLAYSELDQDAARGFRLLGLAPSSVMSRELVHLLVSANPIEGEEIFDQLASRQLLQPEATSTVRMHDLLWLSARELLGSEDPSIRQAAVNRMVNWSMHHLAADYLPQLRLGLNLLPSFGEAYGGAVALSKVYVDLKVIEDSADSSTSLPNIFPRYKRRLVLIAPGGTGKTTLVNHLCDEAAHRRAANSNEPIPLMVLARDVGPDDSGYGLEPIIIRLLRHTYSVDIPMEALQVALQRGDVFLVLDGLDEVLDPSIKAKFVTAINRFSSAYPQTAILITTRPYRTVREDLSGFEVVNIAPWTHEQARRYVSNLASAQRNPLNAARTQELLTWIDSHAFVEVGQTPLSLQLALSSFNQIGNAPSGFNRLIDEVVRQSIFRRERLRGTLNLDPSAVMNALAIIAFRMQSSLRRRVLIDRDSIFGAVSSEWNEGEHDLSSAEFFEALIARQTFFQEAGVSPGGERLFSFIHTAFREYFAARHLIALSPREFVEAVARNISDASWEAVVLAALEQAIFSSREQFLTEVKQAAIQRGDVQVIDALRAWSEQASQVHD